MLNLLAIISIIILAWGSYVIIPTELERAEFRKSKGTLQSNTIFLTFDDGPSKEYTEKLLDLLKREKIRASFFVVGDFARENGIIIQRLKDEGHIIGFHSKGHSSAYLGGYYKTKREWKYDINAMRQEGVSLKYCRPPWGQYNFWIRKFQKDLSLRGVLWDVMAEDWRGNTTSDKIAKKLIERTKNGDVVCLHDGRGRNSAPERTIEALEKVIPYWKEKGYKFATVDEMF